MRGKGKCKTQESRTHLIVGTSRFNSFWGGGVVQVSGNVK